MFRFMALLCDSSDAAACENSQLIAHRIRAAPERWSTEFNVPGLAVFATDVRPGSSQAYRLGADRGVVLGKLFKQIETTSFAAAEAGLDGGEIAAIVQSAGRRLVQGYWGRYVAFIRDSAMQKLWVLRDPMGALPAFTATHRNVTLIFSSTEDCIALGLVHFSLNWRYIAAHVCYCDALQTHATGLNEVAEIQPGECWEFRAHSTPKKTLLWNPTEIVMSGRIDDVDAAVTALRATTKSCIAAWASCYPRILLLLSGGLDSSIVLNCLTRAASRPSVSCLSYFNLSSSASDERHFARLVSQACGCTLLEREDRASGHDLTALLQMPRSARPWLMQYYLTHSRSEGEAARECAANAIFYGVGGDQVFYQGPMRLTAPDHMYDRGLTRESLRTAANVARSEALSVWSVLAGALLRGWLRSRWNPLTALTENRRGLVPAQLVDEVLQDDYLLHPWLTDTRGIAWGKLEHIRMMALSHDFYDPLASQDSAERVRPLISQPLIELCLKIPTYILAGGGCDRLVARRAFADELPREIIRRRAKGMIDSYYHELLEHNLPFVRDLLLDGILVRQGLLERVKLEAVLAGKRDRFGAEVAELIVYHLGTEAWLRLWSGQSVRAAA